MYRHAEQRLRRLINSGAQATLRGGTIGLEKESLRVAADGSIALTPHPPIFGSPLTHPWITTDFSEALLELITPPEEDVRATLDFLADLHSFVYAHLGDEYLWATSMPCILRGETQIPIARYGASNAGRMKHIYRVGLGYRYGRAMQVIAGVHFNYSFGPAFWTRMQALEESREPLRDFMDRMYFGMIRNLQRYGWLIPYLFGASPAVCKSFFGDQPTDMEVFDQSTYYYPYATSVRMGDIGYQNNAEYQAGFKACYDSLPAYLNSLHYGMRNPCPRYADIGVVKNGEYRQLNANFLQIENEYYSTVRPKQTPVDNEPPSRALRQRGVRYVELRSLDVNAFEPLGINEEQLRFLEAFMAFCLFQESPPIGSTEVLAIDKNEIAAAHQGRDPLLQLTRPDGAILLRDWASEICEVMEGFCAVLDEGLVGRPYSASLQNQRAAIADPDRTPSARMLREMRERGESFHDFARRLSRQHGRYHAARPLPPERVAQFLAESERSLERQQRIEAASILSFEDYLNRYYKEAV